MEEFTNESFLSADIPKIEAVEFEHLERDYLYMRLLALGLAFLLLAGALVVFWFKNDIALWKLLLPYLLVLGGIIVLELKGFKIKSFALREKDVSYQSGLIWYKHTSVPFNRIQHCEVQQGVLARLFDLATVKVFTAGGASSDLSISGLSKERAQQLRDFITQLSAQHE
mgnify:CR=1 FL=1